MLLLSAAAPRPGGASYAAHVPQHNPGPGFSVRDLLGSKIYFISALKDSTEAVQKYITKSCDWICLDATAKYPCFLTLMFAKGHLPKN